MWTVIRKGFFANKVRFLLTGIAVVLGVAFVSGTFVLTATIKQTFDDLFANIYKNTGAVVRAPEVLSSDFGTGQRPNVPASLLDAVRATPSVQDAEGNIDTNKSYAQLVDSKGKAVSSGQAPTFGLGWDPNPVLNSFRIVDGHPPQANDEIVIDKHTASLGKFHVGDRVKVLTQLQPAFYKVVGIAKFGTADSLAGASITLFTMPEAQRVNNSVGQFGQILVVAKPGVSQTQVRTDVQRTLISKGLTSYEVLTGKQITKETQDAIEKSLSFFNKILLIFGVVSLLVGIIIIYLTFAIVVQQRQREMALLRALGARRSQVFGQVLGESFVTGVIASAIGVVVGIGLAIALRALLSAFGVDLPGTGVVVPPIAIVSGLIAGTVVTLLSAIAPAANASRIPPVAALRDTQIERAPRKWIRFGLGAAFMVFGLFNLFSGLFGHPNNALAFVGLGAFLIFLGAFVLGPLFTAPVSRFIASPLPKLKGMTGKLAIENAARNPKRTAYTATSLVIVVSFVGFITIFAASAKKSVSHAIDTQFKTDYLIQAGGGFGPPQPVSPKLASQVKALPQIENATGVAFGEVGIGGSRTQLYAVDPPSAAKLVDFNSVSGSFNDLTDGIAMSKAKADDHHWHIGDTVNVTFVKTRTVPLRLQYIFKDRTFGDYYISDSTYARNFDQDVDFVVLAKLKSGVSASQGDRALEPIVAQYPTVKLKSNAQYKADQEAQVNQVVGLVYALLLFSMIISLIGIANTLALSIRERTHEIGLLRAVGMSRRQVRSAVRWESVIISLLGTLNGLAIGLLFGWSMTRALRSQGFTQFAIAPGQLIVVVIVLAVASVGAAWLPARRAAKLDVLRAIAAE